MSADQFSCLLLESEDGKAVTRSVQTLDNGRLPVGDVTVAVKYSTLNYKDGMIINGLGRLVREYPHVPGIDFCGVVEESASSDYEPGDEVILTGWRVGDGRVPEAFQYKRRPWKDSGMTLCTRSKSNYGVSGAQDNFGGHAY